MEAMYLVTGATGFIGSCITRTLISQKRRVSILVQKKTLNWRLSDITSSLAVYECDLLNRSLSEVIRTIRPDYIFHLAAYGTYPREDDVNKMIDINIRGTLNLINALRKNKFKLLIHTGSSSEYGIKAQAMNETDMLEPINDYGVTKAASTLFCQKVAKIEGLPIIIFRLFSPFGYYEDKDRFIPSVILRALESKPIPLSSPHYVRDFIFVEDVVYAYLKATSSDITPGEIFNIGTGKQHNLKEVVDLILELTKSKSRPQWKKIKKQSRQIEPANWRANTTKARRVFNWHSRYTLREGLSKTTQWFSQNQHLYV